jgi:hypothetical protein
MATVNRPPFWVPRPAYDEPWQMPARWLDSGPITLTRTQVKFYGQPGQVPTKPWARWLTDNDPPMWQGSPIHSQSLVLTTTELKWFGAPGQVPTKRWLPYLTYDDPPMWQGAPLNSGAIMATKTQVKIYGQPGQAPTKAWDRWNTYDDPSTWQATVERNLSLLFPTHNPFSNRQWQWSDDPSYWSGEPINSAVLQQLLTAPVIYGRGGQVPPFRWNASYDDASYWSGSPLHAAPIQLLTPQKVFGQGGQVPPFRWNYTIDDPGFWAGAPLYSAIIQNLTQQKVFGQGGQVPPYRWNYTLDDPPSWSPFVERNLSLLFPTTNPFSNRQWQWSDDASVWQGSPLSSGAITATRTQVSIFGQPGQAPPFRWNYTLDDPPSWQSWVRTNINLFSPLALIPRAPFYGPRPSDDFLWQGAPVARNRNVLTTSVEPFNNYKTYWYSEDSFWQGAPRASNLSVLSAQPALILRAPLYAPRPADEPYWQAAPIAQNVSLFSTLAPLAPFHNRQVYWHDDASVWNVWPRASNLSVLSAQPTLILRAPLYAPRPADEPYWQGAPVAQNYSLANLLNPARTTPFSNRQVYWHDDASIWNVGPRGSTIVAASFALYSPRSNWQQWTLRLELDSFWQGSPQSSAATTLTTTQGKFYGQPGQVPPFRPNFTIDDPPMWPGPVPRGSAVIQLPAATTFYGKPGQVVPFRWNYTIDVPPMWQGAPASFNYLLTQPNPPAKPSGNDWIDFRRRARRR